MKVIVRGKNVTITDAIEDKITKKLCSDDYKPGEFYIAKTGNLLVLGTKWEDSVNVCVTKDYWEDSIAPEDYGLVK